MSSVPRSGALALLVSIASLLVACGAQAERPCVVGDQVACTCNADHTYGYRTCIPRDGGGTQYTNYCDCVIGLSPDAGTLRVPYTSGQTSGNRDAGGE